MALAFNIDKALSLLGGEQDLLKELLESFVRDKILSITLRVPQDSFLQKPLPKQDRNLKTFCATKKQAVLKSSTKNSILTTRMHTKPLLMPWKYYRHCKSFFLSHTEFPADCIF